MSNLSNLKVGDKVIVRGTRTDDAVGEVVKITPSGLIDVKRYGYVTRYNQDGYERGGSAWFSTRIIPATDDELRRVYADIDRRKLANDISNTKWNDISYERLCIIKDVLEGEYDD